MPQPVTALPVHITILRADKPAAVTMNFAKHEDVIAATRWRVPRGLSAQPLLQSRAADACEFALLAAKRWRHYRDTSTAATSLPDLRQMIASDPQGEFAFHLTVSAEWFSGILGGAMIRRTWCHHLMVDFLFVHPRISGKIETVRGTGIRILEGNCCLASILGCRRVWGEATRDSAPFYQSKLHRVISDSFFLTPKEITAFARRFAVSVADLG